MIIAVCGWVLWINGPAIRTVGHEIGDLAANSLLILEAKKLELLVGNYSRLGFNHPGPALLYVLAVGEFAFYDLFRVAAAPIGGQLLAACLLSAVWLAFVARLTMKVLGGRTLDSIAATCLIAALLVYLEPQSLGALWFPYVYILPFAVLTLPLALIATGPNGDLWIAVLAAGTLIHGHVSFVPQLILLFVAAFAFRALMVRRAGRGSGIVGSGCGPLPCKPWQLAAATLVAAAFAAPILINTVLNFPGDAAAYLAFGRQPKGHATYEALRFVASSWGGWTEAALGSFVLAAMALRAGMGTAAVAWMILASTLGVFLYAKFGVDDLSHSYAILFYASSIALALSFAITLGVRRLVTQRTVFATIAALSLLAIMILAKPAEVATRNDVPELAKVLTGRSTGTVRLDLDNSQDWAGVWSAAAGVAVELRRAGYDGLCIGENWHIPFTRHLACSPNSSPDARFRLGAVALDAGDPERSFAFGELRLTRLGPP